MSSNPLDTDAFETTSAQPELKPKVLIVEDYVDSRDVHGKHHVIPMNGKLPLIDSLKVIRRIQKNEAQSWGLARSRAARG